MRRRLWPWIVVLGVVVGLGGLSQSPLYSQSELTLQTILNRFFNPTTNTLLTVPYAGAQGPELTPTQIWNRIYDQGANVLRVGGGGGAPDGAAGGDLAGTYPNPTIAANAIGSAEVTDGTLTAADLAANSVDAAELVATAVTPGTYGTETQVGSFTVDADGRITAAANVVITTSGAGGGPPTGPAGGDLTGSTYPNPTLAVNTVDAAELVATAVTPGAYGSATQVGTYTVDADGRLTAAANVTIAGVAPGGTASGDLTGTYPAPTIGVNAIGSAEVTDGTLTADDLAANAVDAAELVATAVTPGAYGSTTQVGTFTVDADGRLTAAANATISLPASTTGIRTSATELETTRDKITTVTGNITLDLHNIVFITVSTGGAIATLPDAADTAKPGKFRLRIADTGAGLLSVAPSAGNTLNGAASAWPGITGQFAGYDVERVSTTGWRLVATSAVPIGELAGGLCRGVNGSTNISTTGFGAYQQHSLTCDIPQQTLQLGSTVEACSMFTVVTGVTAPASFFWVLRANAVSIAGNPGASPLAFGNNIAGRSINLCTRLVVAANAGAAVTVYVAPVGPLSALNSGIDSSWIASQQLPTNALITLSWHTWWSEAGGGTNTVKQDAMSVQVIR